MQVTNYYGNVQRCLVCKSEDIAEQFSYTPAFKNAIDTVFICGCKEHIAEAKAEYYKQTGAKDRVEQAWSNS